MTAVVFAAILIWKPEPDVRHTIVLHEYGYVETASAALWFLAFAITICGALRDRSAWIDWLLTAYVALLCAVRELDIHRRLFGWSIDAPANYWRRPDIAMSERLEVVAFLIIPLAAVLMILWRRWWPRIRTSRADWRNELIFWLASFVFTIAVDKFYLIFRAIGLGEWGWTLEVFEETLELGFALYTAWLLAETLRRRLSARA